MAPRKKGRGDEQGTTLAGPSSLAEEELVTEDGFTFEDEDEDEFDEEDVVVDEAEAGEDDDARALPRPAEVEGAPAAAGASTETRVWRGTTGDLGPDEELEFDPSAYNLFHVFHADWPCLSMAVLPDAWATKAQAPYSAVVVAGTQASKAGDNKVICMQLTNLGPLHEAENDEEEGDEGADEEDMAFSEPAMTHQSFRHRGTVNRLRLMPQRTSVCATWSDTGSVHVWDISPQLDRLRQPSSRSGHVEDQGALVTFSGHSDEGFALDFSPVAAGRFASGDCQGNIHVWEPSDGSSWLVDAPYAGHTSSVEVCAPGTP